MSEARSLRRKTFPLGCASRCSPADVRTEWNQRGSLNLPPLSPSISVSSPSVGRTGPERRFQLTCLGHMHRRPRAKQLAPLRLQEREAICLFSKTHGSCCCCCCCGGSLTHLDLCSAGIARATTSEPQSPRSCYYIINSPHVKVVVSAISFLAREML